VGGQSRVLGLDLIGCYLFGSVVMGDYEPGVSDVDTVAVVRSELTAGLLGALERLHGDLVEATPSWDDRVEAVYVPARGLANFRTRSSTATG
jgi:predicted nucleotidyltransferase